MKNKEKFKDEIVELAINGFSLALVRGKLTSCDLAVCKECLFNKGVSCTEETRTWGEQEYTEPKQKLTKRERDFVDCITADFHLVRECDGTIALFTGGFVLELDEGLFTFILKMTSKKELLQMEVEE